MNYEDRIEAFFGWPENIDEELALAEQLPTADGAEALRIWWRDVMLMDNNVIVDGGEDIIYSALFRPGIGPFVSPSAGMMLSVDWWDFAGRTGAHELYQRCLGVLQLIGRAP